MATIDYKDKYEKAVHAAMLAKQDTESAVTIGILEEIFPELKESEGEKTRKEILDYIIKGSESYYDVQQYGKEKFKKWLAWLEKQGENTYNKELSELLHKVICRFINDPDIPYSDREKVSMKVLPYVERLEKQGEQNLANSAKTCKVEQKPAEWSEEDENIRQWIISDIDKLLALKKKSYIIADKEINWLKSLKERYTWKPSEEQMDALHYVTNFDYGGHKATLVSLYEQLKKLK